LAELFLVEFKGSRKEYCLNKFYHSLAESDHVITQTDRGEDIGLVSKKIDTGATPAASRPRSILRKANRDDLDHLERLRDRDLEYGREVSGLIKKHGLIMKIVDVETQFDGNKMTIYFTADHRVDFRELVKELATKYKTRIELRQIGVRDEARRVGGYGVCGRELCCSSFIKEFVPISTQQAREQDLPMNPAKISGNCGRLLCCLKYESDMYKKAKKKFPHTGKNVRTKHGDGMIIHIDVFNEQAVIRHETEGIFRVNVDEILTGESRPSSAPPRQEAPDIKELAENAEGLKDLDDTDIIN